MTGEGCKELCYAIQKDLDAKRAARDLEEEQEADVRFLPRDDESQDD